MISKELMAASTRPLILTITLLYIMGFVAGTAETAVAQARVSSGCPLPSATLDEAVLEIHNKQQNVGVAATLYGEEGLIYDGHFGLSDLEHQVEIGPETRFGIASITKLFTAVALLKLHVEGKVDLDAPVQRYVPEFPEKNKGTITLRLLATHQSGIPHPSDRTPELFATHFESSIDALEVFRDDTLMFTPGSQRGYSSSNYNLLAAVIEKVSGRTFTEAMQELIFDPLELSNTKFDDVLRPLPSRARRYSFYHPWTYVESDTLYRVPTWDYSFNPGGGNIVSTAGDVAKFGSALWSPGFLPEQQWDLLYMDSWFGFQPPMGGPMILYATGSNPGVQAGITVHPDTKLAAAVISNTWGKGARSAEMVQLANRLLVLCREAGVKNQPEKP